MLPRPRGSWLNIVPRRLLAWDNGKQFHQAASIPFAPHNQFYGRVKECVGRHHTSRDVDTLTYEARVPYLERRSTLEKGESLFYLKSNPHRWCPKDQVQQNEQGKRRKQLQQRHGRNRNTGPLR